MITTDKMSIYRAPSGRAFCYRPEAFAFNTALLYSPDGTEFYATKAYAFSGISNGDWYRKVKLQFEELYTGIAGVVDFAGDRIEFDGEVYENAGDVPDDTMYYPLPNIRVPEFLGRISMTDLYLYVSVSHHDRSPDMYRAFFGNEAGYEEFVITDVETSGTKVLSLGTYHGRIFLRSSLVTDEAFVPQWCGSDLEAVDPSDFDIVEVHGGSVTITMKD